MDEQVKVGKPTGEDSLDRAVEKYTKVKEALDKNIDREDATQFWRNKLGFRLSQSKHYSLIYNTPVTDPPEVKQRLEALEQNMPRFITGLPSRAWNSRCPSRNSWPC